MKQTRQYIVSRRLSGKDASFAISEENRMAELARALKEDPKTDVVSVHGPSENPERLTVRMSSDRAEQLLEHYGDQIIIEEDEFLTPSSGMHPGHI